MPLPSALRALTCADGRSRRHLMLVSALSAGALAAASAGPLGSTYAVWSDVERIQVTAGARAWLSAGDPELPAECSHLKFTKIVLGTNKDDVLVGTAGNDLLFGLAGKDTLDGSGGDDCLVGGNGKDVLLGGAGDDVLAGDNAKDSLHDGSGTDVLLGGKGKDVLDGGAGANVLLVGTAVEPLVAATTKPSPAKKSDAELQDADGGAASPAPALIGDPPAEPVVEPSPAEGAADEDGDGP